MPICQNREIVPLLRKCRLVSRYLVKSESSKGAMLHLTKLTEFCDCMKIILDLVGEKKFRLIYPWNYEYKDYKTKKAERVKYGKSTL